MKVAIIGAGLAGLGVTYFLTLDTKVEVTLFDEKGIGGGASGVCSGLLHPYPGLAARRSRHASEALHVAKHLIKVAETHTSKLVARQNGIVREALTSEQRDNLRSHCDQFKDIEPVDENRFLIHSGITVSLPGYLEGVWNACKHRATLVIEKIESLERLRDFDEIVVAAGYGVRHFFSCDQLKVKFLKGQTLTLEGQPLLKRSEISKGYMAYLGHSSTFEVGSTYEKEFTSEEPDERVARELLRPQLDLYGGGAKVVFGKAGVRVLGIADYLPVAKQMDEKVHVLTGLGSRGLLYHGYFGKIVAHRLLSKNRLFTYNQLV